jgi:hypothetical protein
VDYLKYALEKQRFNMTAQSENDTASQAVVGAELWHKKAPSYA